MSLTDNACTDHSSKDSTFLGSGAFAMSSPCPRQPVVGSKGEVVVYPSRHSDDAMAS